MKGYGRRESAAGFVLAGATFVVVLFFIISAVRTPLLVAAEAGRMDMLYSDASALQTLRLYATRVYGAEEALWLRDSPAASTEYREAQDAFRADLTHVERNNAPAAWAIGRVYFRYAHDTELARKAHPHHRPPRLANDYAALEQLISVKAAALYDLAQAQRTRYDAFKREKERSTFILSLTVVAATILLLVLAHVYRTRLQRSAEERIALLADAAMKDALTGLRNRRAFEDDVTQTVALALRCNHPISLMLIDVDGFKEINDRLGHAAGDELLKYLSARLARFRDSDYAYRLGGDEFAILLPATPGSGAETAARRLLTPISHDGLQITLSAGIAELRSNEDLADWRQRADIALYEAKRRGGGTAVLYASIEAQTRFVSVQAVSRVRLLLDKGEMLTAFQPIWDGPSGAILGFEALARPPQEYGLSGPQEAFDAAQRIGHIVDLDYLCLRSALTAAKLNALDVPIFVNMTPATLEHPLFRAQAIYDLIAQRGLDPSDVVIEVTERSIRDLGAIVRNAEQLRALGLRIALDDVGSGSAGLSVLSALTFDFVKIDRALLVNGNSAKAFAVLTGILAIADSIGAYLIAEGIETPELLEFATTFHQRRRAKTAGVRGFQGYLLGTPQILAPHRSADALFREAARSLIPASNA